MKSLLIFATVAAAGLVAYYMLTIGRNRKEESGPAPARVKKQHHITTAFTAAKQHAIGAEENDL